MKEKKQNTIKKPLVNLLFNIIFIILNILFVVIFYRNILLTTILLGILSVICLVKWKSKLTLIIFIVAIIFGPLSEMIAINFGVWFYSNSNIYNVPLWLFLLWGNAGAFLYQVGLEIKKIIELK